MCSLLHNAWRSGPWGSAQCIDAGCWRSGGKFFDGEWFLTLTASCRTEAKVEQAVENPVEA